MERGFWNFGLCLGLLLIEPGHSRRPTKCFWLCVFELTLVFFLKITEVEKVRALLSLPVCPGLIFAIVCRDNRWFSACSDICVVNADIHSETRML